MSNSTKLILLAIPLFCGCLTDKKLRDHAHRYYAKYPGEFAGDCADAFPVKIIGTSITHKSDTIIFPGITVPCPDQFYINPATHDTVYLPGKTVKCPDNYIIRDSTKQRDSVENTARIEKLKADTSSQGYKIRILTADADKAKSQWWTMIFIIIAEAAIICIGVVVYIKTFK